MTRCVDVSWQPVYGVPQGQWNGMTSPVHQCYHYDTSYKAMAVYVTHKGTADSASSVVAGFLREA